MLEPLVPLGFYKLLSGGSRLAKRVHLRRVHTSYITRIPSNMLLCIACKADYGAFGSLVGLGRNVRGASRQRYAIVVLQALTWLPNAIIRCRKLLCRQDTRAMGVVQLTGGFYTIVDGDAYQRQLPG